MGDPQPADADAQVDGEVLEGELLGPGAVAHDERVTEGEGVARLEVGADALAADVRRGGAVPGEPRLGGAGLHPPLRVAHVRHDDVAAVVGTHDPETEVHRVDHVRRVLALRDGVDLPAERADRVDEALPLLPRLHRVRLVGEVHEGIDPVLHPEVIGSHHHVLPAPRECLAHGLSPPSGSLKIV